MDYSQLYSGEHLKKIDSSWTFAKWSYRHTFEAKMKHIEKLLKKVPKNCKILDAGCGQGLLVQEFRKQGYQIEGLDLFYSSEFVQQGNLLKNNFKDNSFDVVLCLSVIEHFNFTDQEKLISELYRILKKNGTLIISIPNLAHLSSRIYFLFTGKLIRTAKIDYHPGDRPINEYKKMLQQFKIKKIKGLSPTYPVFFQLTQLYPHYTSWLYKFLNIFSYHPWCFESIFIYQK